MSGPLGELPGLLRSDPVIAELVGTTMATVAAGEPVRPLLLAALAGFSSNRILVVTPTSAEADRLAHDLRAYVGDDGVATFPAWETLPFERVSPSMEVMGRRLEVLSALLSKDAGPSLVVAPVKALLQRLATSASRHEPVALAVGDQIDFGELAERLVGFGYRREYQVEHQGEFSVRGGILDVFPPTLESGIRIDCFGDEVERITEFDIVDQRSVHEFNSVVIQACREFIPGPVERARAAGLLGSVSFAEEQFTRIAEGELFDGIESFLPWLEDREVLLPDLLGPDDRVVLVDPRRMRDRAIELVDEEAALASALAVTWGVAESDSTASFPRLHLDFDRLLSNASAKVATLLPVAERPDTPMLQISGWPVALGDPKVVATRIGELIGRACSVVVAADGEGSGRRLAEVLEGEGLDVEIAFGASASPETLRAPGLRVVVAQIDQGFILESAHIAVLAEADLTGRRRPHRMPRARARPVEGFFDDLAVGSFVVHHVHGVARFSGMVKRSVGGAERDYLLLEYRGGDKLYIPSDQIDTITPYSGGEHPALSRLNGNEWQRVRSQARRAVHEVAQELVVLYQRRLAEPGFAFSPDTPWQIEMEQAFPFVETADQLRAIDDVKADMERDVPMDRLVCGDVGFGKTEVALRAVFKAVQDGKQACVLVPTTLLAQQHFQTFSDRYAPYPVRVAMLSRFIAPTEARAVVAGLADGSVDVVIGTHRLLSDGVNFSDLGLLVVDEEQRFGVTHKEAMKKLRIGVDVLTLTASPIPRTLEMGLTGIRDLSVIDTPPAARQPILTYVGEQDDRAVAESIRRELLREGQVFFVHNRVQDIDRTAARLRELVPEAAVAIAHGQMDEARLEQVVIDFSKGDYDVLVCTTIIESGIDMPTVNTLVVDRADLLGLGQLHQLRGRVGRAGQRAYAYLFHPRDRVLSEQAYERLRTIGEHTELGSGFKIAMRDLEIRGAGNLLGSDQSGHIAAIGYDLYVHLVAEAVAELKGERIEEPAELKLDLAVDAHLPSSYVERDDVRLEAYRRLAKVRTTEEVRDIELEWQDRFGPLPAPARALLSVALLRAECIRLGLSEVTAVAYRPGSGGTGRPGEFVTRLAPIKLLASEGIRLSRVAPRAIYKEEIGQVIAPIAATGDLAQAIRSFLEELRPAEVEVQSA
ncbi:MAG TPA: transcription-repair coupling factor [Acidimicrobiales bacterium]